MRYRLLVSLLALPILLQSCGSGGQVTSALAYRDDLTVSLIAGDINIGSRVRATNCRLALTGVEECQVSNVRWKLWQDKNHDGVCQDSEVINSGGEADAKPSHSFNMGTLDFDYADKWSIYVSYSAQGCNGPIDRRTCIGSILP